MSILDEKQELARNSLNNNTAQLPPLPPPPLRQVYDTPEVIVSDGFQSSLGVLDTPELGAEDDVLPAYSSEYDRLTLNQSGFNAGATITEDGRVNININQTSRTLADILAPTLSRQLTHASEAEAPLPPAYIPPSLGGQPGQTPPPKLNVVIQIVGSRGDVQPFIALGQVLKNTYGHRVRIATHGTFKTFVEENGLEFFNIGGDPAELMAFMVKNPGLMPGFDAVKSGEVTKRRKGIEQIVWGCWRSCIEAGDGMGPAPRLNSKDHDNPSTNFDPNVKPFVADAIIANPPSFAHIHIAEKLGVPLHLMFTMPWSPTRAFPQPLANIQSSNTDPVTTNYVSYALIEMMTWQGLGDVINRFRTKVLDLAPLSLMWAPGVLTRLRIPYTYCWSPALIPKPNDWGNHIDVAGFYFLNLASHYTPDAELAAFLEAGPPPIYIGFGSIVVDDPNALTRMIFDAVAETGVRALVSKGWGGLGADSVGIPGGVFMLGNVPHDWLFKHVSAVCHHGGAGTTAAGINAGKPTIVVPFFGDQPFWGSMVARAGAGPDPIPYKKLTAAGLAEAIRVAMKPETQARAQELGAKIREEKGVDVGGQCFHNHLDTDKLRCSVAPSRTAVWRVRRTQVRLSALAAATLVSNGYLQYSDLKLFRAKEYSTEDEPWDPISACTVALLGDVATIGMNLADFPRNLFQTKMRPPPENSTDASSVAKRSDTSTTNDTSSLAPTPSGTSSSERPTTPAAQRSQRGRSPSSPGVEETLERAMGASKSINNIVGAGLKTPMNFCMGLAKGFRNAPRLYHDDTVRPVQKVTSFESGLKIAGKEFGYGLYDGLTGLVTQPLRGAEKEGAVGLAKGFAKGIGGVVFKTSAAAWSLPAYTMAGVHAGIRSMLAQNAQNYIVASRISQGHIDYGQSNVPEREDIESRWLAINKEDMKGFRGLKHKEKGKGREGSEESSVPSEEPKTGWMHTRHLSFDERKRLQEQQKEWKRQQAARQAGHVSETLPNVGINAGRDSEFERAIQHSVRETSRGDAAEDARIEQAIRSSVTALRRQEASMNSPAPAPDMSSAVDFKSRPQESSSSSSAMSADTRFDTLAASNGISDEEYQALIEQAVRLSVQGNTQHHNYDEDGDDDDYQRAVSASQVYQKSSDEDEEFRQAIAASQPNIGQPPTRASEVSNDDEYRRAIEASQNEPSRAPNDREDEEQLQRAIRESAAQAQQEILDEDEQLRKAIEASLIEQ